MISVLHLTINPVKEAREKYKEQVENLRCHVLRTLTTLGIIDQEGSIITTSFIERQPLNTLSMINVLLSMIQKSKEVGDDKIGKNINSKNSSSSSSSTAITESEESIEKKFEHFKKIFQQLRTIYKDVVYLLTGWKISMDRVGNVYCASMYAISEHDKLQFKYNSEDGNLDLVSNTYSEKLENSDTDAMIVLQTTRSYPGFLSTLTSELLEKSTLTIGM